MPAAVRLAVDGNTVAEDLRAMGDDLDAPIRDVFAEHAAIIADMARGFLHHGAPSWPTSTAARDYPAGIRAYYDSEIATPNGFARNIVANVFSTHPAAPVWEWGGHIDPAAGGGNHSRRSELKARSASRAKIRQAGGRQGFIIPADHPVGRAADADTVIFERDLEDAISRLIIRYGF